MGGTEVDVFFADKVAQQARSEARRLSDAVGAKPRHTTTPTQTRSLSARLPDSRHAARCPTQPSFGFEGLQGPLVFGCATSIGESRQVCVLLYSPAHTRD